MQGFWILQLRGNIAVACQAAVFHGRRLPEKRMAAGAAPTQLSVRSDFTQQSARLGVERSRAENFPTEEQPETDDHQDDQHPDDDPGYRQAAKRSFLHAHSPIVALRCALLL